MHIVEPLIFKPSPSEVEIAIERQKYKLPGTDQILTEMNQAGCNIFHSEIHKFINSLWNKEELP
jgi:hypothetical protein